MPSCEHVNLTTTLNVIPTAAGGSAEARRSGHRGRQDHLALWARHPSLDRTANDVAAAAAGSAIGAAGTELPPVRTISTGPGSLLRAAATWFAYQKSPK